MNSDKDTHSKKGKTVFTHAERAESLRHCRWVDQVVEEAPWVITQEFIDKYQVNSVCFKSRLTIFPTMMFHMNLWTVTMSMPL